MCLSLQKEIGAKSNSVSEVYEEREERHEVSSFVKKHRKEFGVEVLLFPVEQSNVSIRLLPSLRLHQFHLPPISLISFTRRNTAMLINFSSSFPTTSIYRFPTVKLRLDTSISTA